MRILIYWMVWKTKVCNQGSLVDQDPCIETESRRVQLVYLLHRFAVLFDSGHKTHPWWMYTACSTCRLECEIVSWCLATSSVCSHALNHAYFLSRDPLIYLSFFHLTKWVVHSPELTNVADLLIRTVGMLLRYPPSPNFAWLQFHRVTRSQPCDDIGRMLVYVFVGGFSAVRFVWPEPDIHDCFIPWNQNFLSHLAAFPRNLSALTSVRLTLLYTEYTIVGEIHTSVQTNDRVRQFTHVYCSKKCVRFALTPLYTDVSDHRLLLGR